MSVIYASSRLVHENLPNIALQASPHPSQDLYIRRVTESDPERYRLTEAASQNNCPTTTPNSN